MNGKFVYGQDDTKRVVNVTVNNETVDIYTENNKGIQMDSRPFEGWILFPYDIDGKCIRLDGELHYKFAKKYHTMQSYNQARWSYRAQKVDHYVAYNSAEMYMIRSGVTYYNNMELEDVSVLSFDIETTGLTHDDNSKVILISNTVRLGHSLQRRLFSVDQYDSDKEMIRAWVDWVCVVNPSIILGHNILGFDLPYLRHCLDDDLLLGRDGSAALFSKYVSQFRKDGSQSYDYQNITIPGREVIDTFFLSIKYDVGRNYPSYGLKAIIDHEGLTREGREFYDAGSIRDNYQDPDEMEKIKRYCVDDADDSLALFDLMAPSFFYYTQSIPKTFQQIVNGASGSQINSFLIRSYLSEGHSIPQASDAKHYQGAISFGNPGRYNNVGKADVASLYPSLILQHRIFDPDKDPKAYFLKMVDIFTKERLENKRLANETGERGYRDVEQAQKIIINSAYGFMGAPGLNFNSPMKAALVTKLGRGVVEKAVELAEKHGLTIVNGDTDSISYTRDDLSLDKAGHYSFIELLNSEFPKGIVWEDDGFFTDFIVVKAKNYVMRRDDGKLTIKGSALKATMKEPALKEFIKNAIHIILNGNDGDLDLLYNTLVGNIATINSDIRQWCSKKTVTKKVLHPARTNEQRILDAIHRSGRRVQEGDKINVFFRKKDELALAEMFDGEYDSDKLYQKLFDTVKILSPILDIKRFPNYKLKKNKGKLDEIVQRHTVLQSAGLGSDETDLRTTMERPGGTRGQNMVGSSGEIFKLSGIHSSGGDR